MVYQSLQNDDFCLDTLPIIFWNPGISYVDNLSEVEFQQATIHILGRMVTAARSLSISAL